MFKKIILSVTVVSWLGACTTASQNITADYISPLQFSSYDCQQLGQESQRVLSRVKQLGVQLDKAAQNDKAIGVVGAVLFWPALFALGGNKQQEAEYGRLKGEYEAISQTQIQKKCGMTSTSTPQTQVSADKDFADVSNAEAVPYLDERGRQGFRDWLKKPTPRAFVISPSGQWNSSWGPRGAEPHESPDPLTRALTNCEKRSKDCKVYAQDNRVVWVPSP